MRPHRSPMTLELMTAAPETTPVAPSIVVSVTMSIGAILTALATLFRVARWIGHTDATTNANTQRLDEIRQDVREIRAAILSGRSDA